MKLHYIILALCLMFGYEVSAQDYQISSDRKTITVTGNCSIPVEEFAPFGVNIYGNREKGGVGSKKKANGQRISVDLFSEKTARLNNNPKGISFKRNQQDSVATVVIDFAQINGETSLTFYQAISTEKRDTIHKTTITDWSPDKSKTFHVTIVKSQPISDEAGNSETSLRKNQPAHSTSEINDIKEVLNSLNDEVDELKNKGDQGKDVFNVLPLLITLFVGLIIGYFLYKQNRKDLKELSKECSDLRKTVDNWEKNNNVQVVPHQTTLQKNKGKYSMTDDDIKRFIVEQIKSLQPQYGVLTNQPVVATNPVPEFVTTLDKKEEKTTNTDNVKYHQDDNFFSLEQTDIKIFRIYSHDEKYYYTIVDDSAVREELIGMLQMFEGCITYQTTASVAKRVEPVSDGQLRKDGNKFYVDTNNKLVVRFI